MAAKMKAANKRQVPQGGQRTEPNSTYLLTGLLRCKNCGGRMKPNRSGRRPLYKCVNNGHPSHGDGATNITAEHAEEAVMRVLGSPLLAPLKQGALPSRASLERKIRAVEDRKRRAYDAFEAGLQTLREYSDRAYELESEIAQLRGQQMAAIAGPPPPVDPSLPRDVLRDRIRQWVERVLYPVYHKDVKATRSGLRPMVRVDVDEGDAVVPYYAPIYRTGFTGARTVFTEEMLKTLPSAAELADYSGSFHPWLPPCKVRSTVHQENRGVLGPRRVLDPRSRLQHGVLPQPHRVGMDLAPLLEHLVLGERVEHAVEEVGP